MQRRGSLPARLRSAAAKTNLPVWIALAHAPLGIILYSAGTLGIVHPLLVFILGIRQAWNRQTKLEQVAPYVAYLGASEVLWRMAQLPILWETGKYASAIIILVALFRRGYKTAPLLPLLYFLFLLPSCVLTLLNRDLEPAKVLLSFSMSGPTLLFVCCWFFSYLKVDWQQVRSLLFVMMIPLLSVAVATLFFTVTTENIEFNTESNHATSGGFGPNQVSAMLGMGAFLCIAAYLLFKNRFQDALWLGIFTILFTAQSVMTFSRGGIYNAAGGVLVIILVQLLNPGVGIKRLLPVIGIVVIFLLLVFPFLNDFTGGQLQTRFEESDPTNRSTLLEADFQMFAENPILGVGAGESFFQYLEILGKATSSHTEFSRLVAEHGMLGILAIGCLLLIFFKNFQQQKTNEGKAFIAGVFIWSCLFMLNAGMRLAAPSFVFGMGCLTVVRLRPTRKLPIGRTT
ncbi:MAG: O-antigen ligase family protein [Pyrinomonadaceae bacterium]